MKLRVKGRVEVLGLPFALVGKTEGIDPEEWEKMKPGKAVPVRDVDGVRFLPGKYDIDVVLEWPVDE